MGKAAVAPWSGQGSSGCTMLNPEDEEVHQHEDAGQHGEPEGELGSHDASAAALVDELASA